MRFRQGVQAEVLLSLLLVMITGTALLAAILLEINQARIEALQGVLGRGFVSAARAPGFELHPLEGGAWWRIDREGRVTGLNASADDLDEETRALASEALALDDPLVVSGSPWDPIRFASPDRALETVVAGRIDAPVSGLVLMALFLVDVVVFGLFGVTLLRRRVVGPLRRLSRAVREIGEGDLPATVPVEGAGEIEALGSAFNEMQAALTARTGALEKAVRDLRTANASLLQARTGLDRAERLAMVGSLAAGVAHEVGNPMGALLAFLDVASRDPGLGDEGRRCLERAIEQGERVRIILRQLLDFSRPPQVEHGPMRMGEVVRQVVELISAQKEFSDIEFEIRAPEEDARAWGDVGIASQILLNLALNAAAAIRESATRKIRFEIRGDVSRRRAGEDQPVSAAGRRVESIVCRVADSGPGIDLEDPERIFDPFFTTKAPGEGTGLGLANARRLAEEMGGGVELEQVRSDLGGAQFLFRMPAENGRAAPTGEVRRPEERGAPEPDGAPAADSAEGGSVRDQSRIP
ncbi:MAG TPA: HAMP domain-containing histidine kinase [Deltaproteobacteria bacterium]|nr:HAMP domain-containing histidine kinase [Deltaproteobacteria bacterium]